MAKLLKLPPLPGKDSNLNGRPINFEMMPQQFFHHFSAPRQAIRKKLEWFEKYFKRREKTNPITAS
jgi:hypothetical protein